MNYRNLFYITFIFLVISLLSLELQGVKKKKPVKGGYQKIKKYSIPIRGVRPVAKAEGAVRRRVTREVAAIPIVKELLSEKSKKRVDVWTAELRIEELERQMDEYDEKSEKYKLIKKKYEDLKKAKEDVEFDLNRKRLVAWKFGKKNEEFKNLDAKDSRSEDEEKKYKELEEEKKVIEAFIKTEKGKVVDENIDKNEKNLSQYEHELGESLNIAENRLKDKIEQTRADVSLTEMALEKLGFIRTGIETVGIGGGVLGLGGTSVASYLGGEYDIDDESDYEPEELGIEGLEPKRMEDEFGVEGIGEFDEDMTEEPQEIEFGNVPSKEPKKIKDEQVIIPNFLKFPKNMKLTAEEAADSLQLLAKYIKEHILPRATKLMINAKEPVIITMLDGEKITFDGKAFAERYLEKYENAKNVYIKSRDRYKKLVSQKKAGEEILDESIALAKKTLSKKKELARQAFISKRNGINKRAIFLHVPERGSAINIIKSGIKIIQKHSQRFNEINVMKIFNFLQPLGIERIDIVEFKDIEEISELKKTTGIEEELFGEDIEGYKKTTKRPTMTISKKMLKKESLSIVKDLKKEFKRVGKEITSEEYEKFKKDLLEPKPEDKIETQLIKKMAGEIWRVVEDVVKGVASSVKSSVKGEVGKKSKTGKTTKTYKPKKPIATKYESEFSAIPVA